MQYKYKYLTSKYKYKYLTFKYRYKYWCCLTKQVQVKVQVQVA